MLELLKVILFGIVEGFTEWLPISSTGHMIILEDLINLKASTDFKHMFLVVIQLGAILSIALMYFNRLNPFSKKRSKKAKKGIFKLWIKIFIACLPAGLIGLFLDDLIDEYFYNGYIVAFTLIFYGIIFIFIENRNKNKKIKIDKIKDIDYNSAFYIGTFQILSLIPGTSRSGACILGAILLGCSRVVATEFSFFLGLPLIGAASLLKLIKFGFNYTIVEFIYLLLGFIISFIVSVFSISFFMNWIKKHDFKAFGIYRIVLGIIVFIWYLVTSLLHI